MHALAHSGPGGSIPRTNNHRRRHGLAATFTLITVAALLPLGLVHAQSAQAVGTDVSTPDALVSTGDILVAADGGIFTGDGIDKINPVTREVSRAASFGEADGIIQVADAPSGDFFVGNRNGDVIKLDNQSGEETLLRDGSQGGAFALEDLVIAKDGSLVALPLEDIGVSLIRIAQTGAVTSISQGGHLLAGAHSIAIEHDGRILVTSGPKLLRIDPVSGGQSVVTTFPSIAGAIAVREDGQIFVRTARDVSTPPRLVRVHPLSGAQATVTSGGFLSSNTGEGMAMENGTFVVVAQEGPDASNVVRINTFTGSQDQLIRRDNEEALDISVAGVSQIPPTPLPVAVNDAFTMQQGEGQLHVSAPGVLGNDSDPLGQSMTTQLVTQSGSGFVSLITNGEFFYFPAGDFVGTDTFTYRVVSGGRLSAVATVSIEVRPGPLPIAVPDDFVMDSRIGEFKGSVLGNDSDPLSQALTARQVTTPANGFTSFNPDGVFFYFPNQGFIGFDSFTYQAVAADGRASAAAKVTIQVTPGGFQSPPVIAVATGGSVGTNGRSGTMNLAVNDIQTPPAQLTMSATSSNTSLVPVANIKFGGSGKTRTVNVAAVAGKNGLAVVTVKVTDGNGDTATVTITVKVGDSTGEIITGTNGPDMLFGLGGADKLSGLNGNDLLGGGAQNDALTGGLGADVFRGGLGLNKATDFDAAQGDTKSEVG